MSRRLCTNLYLRVFTIIFLLIQVSPSYAGKNQKNARNPQSAQFKNKELKQHQKTQRKQADYESKLQAPLRGQAVQNQLHNPLDNGGRHPAHNRTREGEGWINPINPGGVIHPVGIPGNAKLSSAGRMARLLIMMMLNVQVASFSADSKATHNSTSSYSSPGSSQKETQVQRQSCQQPGAVNQSPLSSAAASLSKVLQDEIIPDLSPSVQDASIAQASFSALSPTEKYVKASEWLNKAFSQGLDPKVLGVLEPIEGVKESFIGFLQQRWNASPNLAELDTLIESMTLDQITAFFPNPYISKELLKETALTGLSEFKNKELLRDFILSSSVFKRHEEYATAYYSKFMKASGIQFNHDQTLSLVRLIPSITSIKLLTKKGINDAYEVIDGKGQKSFIKLFTEQESRHFSGKSSFLRQFPSLHEAASSKLASYITDGLVPAGKSSGGLAIQFPMVEVDLEATKALFTSGYPNFKPEDIYQKIKDNEKLKSQVFVNLIADIVLESDDTHSGNFGVDKAGNFLGFDKGRSYFNSVFTAGSIPLFSFNMNSLEKSPVYGSFIKHLKQNPDDLKKILKSEAVQQALIRVDALSKNKKELRDQMSPLFKFLSHQVSSSGQKNPSLEAIEESYFNRLKGLVPSLAHYFNLGEKGLLATHTSSEPTEVLNYHHDSYGGVELDMISFDPRENHPTLKAPIEKGIPGAKVSSIVERSKGLAGINAGFFSFGDGAGMFSWLKYKAANKAGLSHNPAFPTAILKTQDYLISDTAVDDIPALGWTEDGAHTLIGNLKVQWQARSSQSNKGIGLSRQTPLNHEVQTQYLYLPSPLGKHSKGDYDLRIKIDKGKVVEIVHSPKEIDKSLPNGYLVDKNDLNTDHQWLRSLRVGDPLSIDHHYQSKDISGWDKMTNIVSGGAILVKDGALLTTFPAFSNPNTPTPRTAICVMPDGKWKMVVSKFITLTNLATYFHKQGCSQAINMDGGGSPTLHLNSPSLPKTMGSDIVVSDAIVIMPKQLPSLNAHTDSEDIFSLVKRGHLAKIETHLHASPQLANQQDHMGRNPLMLAIEQEQADVAQLLISKMDNTALTHTDHYGETALHSALRKNQLKTAELLAKRWDPSDLFLMGMGKDTPLTLALQEPHSKAAGILIRKFSQLKEGDHPKEIKSLFSQALRDKNKELVQVLESKMSVSETTELIMNLLRENKNYVGFIASILTDEQVSIFGERLIGIAILAKDSKATEFLFSRFSSQVSLDALVALDESINLDSAKLLFSKIPVEKLNIQGKALFKYSVHHDPQIVEFLLSHLPLKVILDTITEDGGSMITTLIRAGEAPALKLLIPYMSGPAFNLRVAKETLRPGSGKAIAALVPDLRMAAATGSKDTLLESAVKSGSLETLKLVVPLMQAKDFNVLNQDGESLLHLAAKLYPPGDTVEALKIILPFMSPKSITAVNNEGKTFFDTFCKKMEILVYLSKAPDFRKMMKEMKDLISIFPSSTSAHFASGGMEVVVNFWRFKGLPTDDTKDLVKFLIPYLPKSYSSMEDWNSLSRFIDLILRQGQVAIFREILPLLPADFLYRKDSNGDNKIQLALIDSEKGTLEGLLSVLPKDEVIKMLSERNKSGNNIIWRMIKSRSFFSEGLDLILPFLPPEMLNEVGGPFDLTPFWELTDFAGYEDGAQDMMLVLVRALPLSALTEANKNGETPLSWAKKENNEALIKIIKQRLKLAK